MKLIEDWKVSRFVKNYPIFTIQPNGWAYSNCILDRLFGNGEWEVYYKFTNEGIQFSWYEKRGYKLLKKYIKFPEYWTPEEGDRNVFILEKISLMKYKFFIENRKTKLKVFKA